MNKIDFFKEIGNRKFLFFDTETTGLYPLEKYAPEQISVTDILGNNVSFVKKEDYMWDEMIEIGYILYDPVLDKVIETGEYLIKNNKPISDLIYGITGISQHNVDEKGVTQERLYEILRPILDENPILVAYNTKFDITFLHKWLLEIDPVKYKYFNFDVLDVMTIYANYYPFSHEIEKSQNHAGEMVEKKYGHRLVGAIRTLCNRELKQTHRALDDIEETIVAFKELEKRVPDIYDFINVLGYHPASHEWRGFDCLKPYHVVVLPLGYNGGDYLHRLINQDKPKEYNRYLIPKWIWSQNFKTKLRKDIFSQS